MFVEYVDLPHLLVLLHSIMFYFGIGGVCFSFPGGNLPIFIQSFNPWRNARFFSLKLALFSPFGVMFSFVVPVNGGVIDFIQDCKPQILSGCCIWESFTLFSAIFDAISWTPIPIHNKTFFFVCVACYGFIGFAPSTVCCWIAGCIIISRFWYYSYPIISSERFGVPPNGYFYWNSRSFLSPLKAVPYKCLVFADPPFTALLVMAWVFFWYSLQALYTFFVKMIGLLPLGVWSLWKLSPLW